MGETTELNLANSPNLMSIFYSTFFNLFSLAFEKLRSLLLKIQLPDKQTEWQLNRAYFFISFQWIVKWYLVEVVQWHNVHSQNSFLSWYSHKILMAQDELCYLGILANPWNQNLKILWFLAWTTNSSYPIIMKMFDKYMSNLPRTQSNTKSLMRV